MAMRFSSRVPRGLRKSYELFNIFKLLSKVDSCNTEGLEWSTKSCNHHTQTLSHCYKLSVQSLYSFAIPVSSKRLQQFFVHVLRSQPRISCERFLVLAKVGVTFVSDWLTFLKMCSLFADPISGQASICCAFFFENVFNPLYYLMSKILKCWR